MSDQSLSDFDNLVIFDTDIGTDDAWALLMLLRAEEEFKKLKVLGVTCVHGNTKIENVTRNTFLLLDAVNRSDIPVYKGASSALLPPARESVFFHGKDGFGDIFEYKEDASVESRLQKKHAVHAMYDFVCKYPKRISFVLVGPLTNFALCLKMYSDFAEKVKDIFIMGGNMKAVGNISACAEFNFYFDPEAAFIVTNEDKIIKTILPWESCLLDTISMDWRLNTLGSINNEITKLLDPIEKKCYEDSTLNSWTPCDAYLVAAFLFPKEFIIKESKWHVAVELNGTHTRGQMVLDHMKTKCDNARIIESIDLEYFKKIGLWAAKHNIKI